MGALTTRKLGATVGAEVLGVDPEAVAVGRHAAAGLHGGARGKRGPGLPPAPYRRRHPGRLLQATRRRRQGRARRAAADLQRDARSDEELHRRVPAGDGLLAHRRRAGRRPQQGNHAQRACDLRHGGETEFASTYAAYDDLTDAEKSQCEDLRVLHSLEASQRLVYPDPTPEQLAGWRSKPDKEHPLVWQHRSGRRSLVIGVSASHVVGMDLAEGKALLDDLLERSTAPERVYRHEWTVGDLVIWDNTGVMHRVHPYDPTSGREMHRTTMSGDEPIR